MDRYQRTTQLGPAVAAVAPFSIAALATFRIEDLPRSLAAVAVAAGFHLVIMRLVRDRGNTVQTRLWTLWGGNPAAVQLRWSTARDQRAHAALHREIQAITDVKLPKAAVERADPERADVTYERAVADLRDLTRDRTRFHRVFTELIEYSTARNLLGVKPIGLTVAVTVVLLSGAAAVLNVLGRTDFAWLPIILSGTGALIVSFLWVVIITPTYVQRPARRYADALLGAAAELHQ